jgi:hypothetical protein
VIAVGISARRGFPLLAGVDEAADQRLELFLLTAEVRDARLPLGLAYDQTLSASIAETYLLTYLLRSKGGSAERV